MSKKWLHFKASYRGVFEKIEDSSAHNYHFYELKLRSIEIRDLQRVEHRMEKEECVFDFLYYNRLTPKRWYWPFGVELMVIKDDATAFSETLHRVVLQNHSGKRIKRDLSIREHVAIVGSSEQILSGDIYFSIPDPTPPPPPVAVAPASVIPSPEVITMVEPPVIAEPQVSSFVVPDLVTAPVVSQNAGCSQPQLLNGCRNPGCSPAGGCFSKLGGIVKWIFIILFLLGLLGQLANYLKRKVKQQDTERVETKDGSIRMSDPILDPRQDTLAPQPWNYLINHEINWGDFESRDFLAHYTTSTYSFEESGRLHSHWEVPQTNNELLYWHDVYEDFSSHDRTKLDSLVEYFRSERQTKGLNALQTAEMVVTFIQEIPYYLVHDGSCEEASQQGGFVEDYHDQGLPCKSEVIAGVQSPYEFLHDLKGDCDTRSLLGFTILKELGIPASVWVSRAYGHSIMGVAVPAGGDNFKMVDGARHFGVELTAKGFRIGMMAPDQTALQNWNVVLN